MTVRSTKPANHITHDTGSKRKTHLLKARETLGEISLTSPATGTVPEDWGPEIPGNWGTGGLYPTLHRHRNSASCVHINWGVRHLKPTQRLLSYIYRYTVTSKMILHSDVQRREPFLMFH